MMFRTAALAAAMTCAATATAQIAPSAPRSQWTKTSGQGAARNTISYQTGTFDQPVDAGLRLTCPARGPAVLTVQIKGVKPEAGRLFLLIPETLQGTSQSFTFTAGPKGELSFARARTDRTLARLWTALRGGSNLTVRYSDGSFAVVSLAGARATLPARPCA